MPELHCRPKSRRSRNKPANNIKQLEELPHPMVSYNFNIFDDSDKEQGQTYHEPLMWKTLQSTRPVSGKRKEHYFSSRSLPTATRRSSWRCKLHVDTQIILVCVLSLLAYSREVQQTDRGFQPKVSFPLILLFQDHQEDPTASAGSLFKGIKSSPRSKFDSWGNQNKMSFGRRQQE